MPDPNQVDAYSLSFCLAHDTVEEQRNIMIKGACTCGDVLDFADNPEDAGLRAEKLIKCSSIDTLAIQFCRNPLKFPIVVGESDGRIERKVN